MDGRFEEIVSALKAADYTDRYVPEHWDIGGWQQGKRWYGFEDPSETILQIVTGNIYTRLVLVSDEKLPFVYLQYTAPTSGEEACPDRPKTCFLRDQSPTATRKSIAEVIIRLIPELHLAKDWKAA